MIDCCENPAPVREMQGSVTLFYGEYHDDLHEVIVCRNCGTVLYDEAAEQTKTEVIPY